MSYPPNTTPEYSDGPVGTFKKILKVLNGSVDTVLGVLRVNIRKLTAVDDTVNAILGASASTTAATLAQINKTVAATGTPEAISGSANKVESVLIKALKGRATANTGVVYIGFSATNDAQLHALAPGEEMTLTAPDGKKIDTAAIYIDVATNGDGVICTTVN